MFKKQEKTAKSIKKTTIIFIKPGKTIKIVEKTLKISKNCEKTVKNIQKNVENVKKPRKNLQNTRKKVKCFKPEEERENCGKRNRKFEKS